MIFLCYSKCTTCRKAKAFLDEAGASYETREIKLKNPTYDELKKWLKISGRPVQNFFGTNSTLFKELGLKNKYWKMTDEECLSLLATDGMLVKRPILVGNGFVLVGFNIDEWSAVLAK